MRILFYLNAGAGDLINFTGILAAIKAHHKFYTIDFLVKKSHAYILDGHKGVDNILFFEDFPHIPQHCTFSGHDESIKAQFKHKYNHVLGVWGVLLNGHNHHGDFVGLMFDLMKRYGFVLPVSRREVSPIFFFGPDDYEAVGRVVKGADLEGKKVVLIEDSCTSWSSPQVQLQPSIIEWLNAAGHITVGNSSACAINISKLNLKRVRLFFELHCTHFLGLSSGITCAMYARPNYFLDKQLLVSGIVDGWDMSKNLDCGKGYTYMKAPYTIENVKSLLEG